MGRVFCKNPIDYATQLMLTYKVTVPEFGLEWDRISFVGGIAAATGTPIRGFGEYLQIRARERKVSRERLLGRYREANAGSV